MQAETLEQTHAFFIDHEGQGSTGSHFYRIGQYPPEEAGETLQPGAHINKKQRIKNKQRQPSTSRSKSK